MMGAPRSFAYSFGLRHVVDADHMAAIDNVTRAMMQDGHRPVAVGLMFSLGHSTVVVAGSMIIAFGASTLQHFGIIREIGGIFRTINLHLVSVWDRHCEYRRARFGPQILQATAA